MSTITTRSGKGSPLTNTEVDNNFVNLNTDKIEDLTTFNTDDLLEGSLNLYYTDERVDDRVNTFIQAGLGITTSYDDVNNELTIESDTIEENCKNATASTILKGTPVYQTGTAGNAMEIAPADASDLGKMPAVGVLAEDLDADAEGKLLLMGRISGVDTSAFSEGDVIYVASGGGYTNTRPIGESFYVQNLGRVTKISETNGGGVVMGSGRINDVPNLGDGKIFIGNGVDAYQQRAPVVADISDLTATATELNYTDGVTSSIQTQLNNKQPLNSVLTNTTASFTTADETKLDGIESGATADQTASEILTAIKTVDGTGSGLDADLLDGQEGSYYTNYTDTAVANLVDSAPGTLDTLNELAAALGDDANFATTVTNTIATKMPIAGGTFTGNVDFSTGIDVTGNITVTGTVDGRDIATDGATLDALETLTLMGGF